MYQLDDTKSYSSLHLGKYTRRLIADLFSGAQAPPKKLPGYLGCSPDLLGADPLGKQFART